MPLNDTPDDAKAERARKRHAATLRRLRKATRDDLSVRPCSRCLKVKPVSEYPKYSPARCRDCYNARARPRRANNFGPSYDAARHQSRRTMLADAKNRPCADCGGTFPACAMDFDHRDPRQKRANIGRILFGGLDRLAEEIAKHDVVCSNCHRIRTQRQRKAGLLPPSAPRSTRPNVALSAKTQQHGNASGARITISAREVMGYIGVSRSWVQDHRAELGGFKLGGVLRFDLNLVDAYLDRHQIRKT